jgi:hypothetical protein
MELFITLAKKIIFPEIEFSENDVNSRFENFIKEYNSPNKFVCSIYKFLIMHNLVLKTNNYKSFENKDSIKTQKIDFLKRNMENVFFTEEDRNTFLDYFSEIQKHYFAFMRLCNIWKYKHSRITVSDDLYLNPIDVNAKNVFVVVHNKNKYLFSLANLINMINSSLSNTCHFFSSPLILKNPYSNIIFNKADLYNLYFAIKNSSFIMPVLFHYYFLTNFNITKFRDQYEGIIREISIKNHIKNADHETLYNAVINMLKSHKHRININPEFPKEELVDIMRPYLQLYYVSMYSLDEYKKLNAFSELHRKLNKFYKYNPKFGRKIVKRECNADFKFITKIVFNKKYVDFNKAFSIEEFMKNHERCEKNSYDSSSDEEYESEEINNRPVSEDVFRISFQTELDTRPFQIQSENIRNENASEMEIVPYDNIGYSQRYSVFDEDSIYREITEDFISDENADTVAEYTSSSESDSDGMIIKEDSDTESDISE